MSKAVRKSGDAKAIAALDALEPVLFGGMALALDRAFVHRVRMVTGKDTTPLNELELIADSLMNNHGIFRGNSVIKYRPEQSVLGLQEGDRVAITARQFDQLAAAVLGEVRDKFR